MIFKIEGKIDTTPQGASSLHSLISSCCGNTLVCMSTTNKDAEITFQTVAQVDRSEQGPEPEKMGLFDVYRKQRNNVEYYQINYSILEVCHVYKDVVYFTLQNRSGQNILSKVWETADILKRRLNAI